MPSPFDSFDDVVNDINNKIFNSVTSNTFIYAVGSITGSFISGSFIGDGTEIEGVITSSYSISSSHADFAISASHALKADQTKESLSFGAGLLGDAFDGSTEIITSIDSGSFAGTGLGADGTGLIVNVDDTTIEIDSDNLRVKDGGISNTKLTNSSIYISGSGISNEGSVALGATASIDVQVDDSTIEISGNNLKVKPGGITTTEIADSLGNINENQFTGSFLGDGSGLTGIEADSVAFDDITGKPTLISSSIQIDHDQTTNFEADEHFTQADITEVGTVITGNVDAILPSNIVSSSIQIDHDQTTNFEADEHFLQEDITTVGTVTTGNVDAILPSNLISSSLQFNNLTSPFTGSFTGSFVGDGSGLTGIGSVTSIETTEPLTGGTITETGTIGITQATTSTDGYLSSTDWNTFNDKTICTGTVTSVTSGDTDTITIGGTLTDPTVAANTAAILDGGTNLATGDQIYDHVTTRISGLTDCTGTVTGTGTSNQIATWNTTSELDGSSNLTFDGTTLDVSGITKTDSILVNATAPIANSIITLKKANTSTGTDVGLFYDITKENTTNSLSESYGVVNRVDSTTDFNNRGIITQNNIGRVTGAGNFSYIYPSYNQASIKGAGTVNFAIGGVNEASLNNASGTVNNLWGTHTEVQLTAGTAGEISLLNFDFDQSAGTTITGDFQYINISNDQPVLNIGGTARALNIESNLPSFFSGSIGIGTPNPSTKLHVYDSGGENHITIDGTSGGNRNLRFATENSTRWNLYTTGAPESGGNIGSDFTIGRYSDGGTYIDNPLFIKRSTGNVGIGTTDPSAKLHLFKSEDSSDDIFKIEHTNWSLGLNLGNIPDFTINSIGNVGIGTTDPGVKLEVAGSTTIGISHTNNGTYSFIGGGICNTVESKYDSILGGDCNSIINTLTGYTNVGRSSIIGGCCNVIDGTRGWNFIAGGYNNTISGSVCGFNNYANVILGRSSLIDACDRNSITGGGSNIISGSISNSNIAGGVSNCITGTTSTVGGGAGNNVLSSQSIIAGGLNNMITNSYSTIGGGTQNTIESTRSGILGGTSNCITHSDSFVIGSNLTSTAACTTFMNNSVIAGSLTVGQTSALSSTAGRIDATNDIVAFSSSDKRWKTNIVNIDDPIEKINKINGVSFDWIEDSPVHGNKGHDIGVIAQEVEAILPQIVNTRSSGMKAVRYEKLIPLLIEGIKDLQKQINDLKKN